MTRSQVEIETHRRIKLAIWAYAYEFENRSIVSDAQFDVESYLVDLNVRTARPDMDLFFICEFKPHTGQWIHRHPELERIKQLYKEFYT